jgi:hypothetical protein
MNIANNQALCKAVESMKDALEWSDVADEYVALFKLLPDDLARPLLRRIKLGHDWRPSVAQIVEDALDVLDPLPDVYQTWLEIDHMRRAEPRAACERVVVKAGFVGPINSNYWRTVKPVPQFAHPVVERTVAMLGGWSGFAASGFGDNPALDMRRRFEKIFAVQCAAWRSQQKAKVGDLNIAPRLSNAWIAPAVDERLRRRPDQPRDVMAMAERVGRTF